MAGIRYTTAYGWLLPATPSSSGSKTYGCLGSSRKETGPKICWVGPFQRINKNTIQKAYVPLEESWIGSEIGDESKVGRCTSLVPLICIQADPAGILLLYRTISRLVCCQPRVAGNTKLTRSCTYCQSTLRHYRDPTVSTTHGNSHIRRHGYFRMYIKCRCPS
jgi:hypothetical protein